MKVLSLLYLGYKGESDVLVFKKFLAGMIGDFTENRLASVIDPIRKESCPFSVLNLKLPKFSLGKALGGGYFLGYTTATHSMSMPVTALTGASAVCIIN
jgi:hypothetical protein